MSRLESLLPKPDNDTPVDLKPHLPTTSNPAAVENFITSAIINTIFGIILILFFSWCRRRIEWLYVPVLVQQKEKILQEGKSEEAAETEVSKPSKLPTLSNSFFGWFPDIFRIPLTTIQECSGPDAYIFLLFFYYSTLLFFLATILGGILAVIHYMSEGQQEGFEKLAISNVPDGSHRLYAHVIVIYVVHLVCMYMLHLIWQSWMIARHTWLKEQNEQDKLLTLLVQNIPRATRTDRSFSSYFHRLYPHSFKSAVLAKDTRSLQSLITRRELYLQKLTSAYHYYERTGIRPRKKEGKGPAEKWFLSLFCSGWICESLSSCCCYLCRSNVDALNYYAYKLNKYNTLITATLKQISLLRPLYCGFVTFKSSLVAHTAVKAEHNDTPFQYLVKSAPLPTDMHWSALYLSRRMRFTRSVVVNILVIIGLLFWSVPIAFINSLSNLTRLAHSLPFLSPILMLPPRTIGILEGYLPSLALSLIMLILPLLLWCLCHWQGIEAKSWIELNLTRYYFLFQIFNFFIINIVANSLFTVLFDVLDHPSDLLYLLADAIPAVSPFFINFIMLRALTVFPLELSRLSTLLLTPLSNCIYGTSNNPPLQNCPYGSEYPEHLLILTVGLTYAVITPLLLPFVLLYFSLGYVCKCYECLYIYTNDCESGGVYWPTVYSRIMFSLYLSQLTLVGLFGLKESPASSTAMVVLIIMTAIYSNYVWSAYYDKGSVLPVENAEEVDRVRKEKRQKEKNDKKAETEKQEEKENLSGKDNAKKEERKRKKEEEEEKSREGIEDTVSIANVSGTSSSSSVSSVESILSDPYIQPELLAPPRIDPPVPYHLLFPDGGSIVNLDEETGDEIYSGHSIEEHDEEYDDEEEEEERGKYYYRHPYFSRSPPREVLAAEVLNESDHLLSPSVASPPKYVNFIEESLESWSEDL